MGEHTTVTLQVVGRQRHLARRAGMTVERDQAQAFRERAVAEAGERRRGYLAVAVIAGREILIGQ
jgi:hypothetical protein